MLKYYSFENYFLNPLVMEKLGIIKSEEAFYETLFEKWKEYLHRMKSGKKLLEILGKDLLTIQDIKSHMEEIKIYMRGHNPVSYTHLDVYKRQSIESGPNAFKHDIAVL